MAVFGIGGARQRSPPSSVRPVRSRVAKRNLWKGAARTDLAEPVADPTVQRFARLLAQQCTKPQRFRCHQRGQVHSPETSAGAVVAS